ncbi:thiol reductant ABC exporter subunit CydD [Enemella sp. A6]|uniref:thiol reductant ABC exporter subunit CydD n=1 Tax=Enemella sp. A6 TaxID=3440152 RepID=UPI003EB77143
MAGPVHPGLLRRARATRRYLVAGAAVGCATAILVIGQAWLLSRQVSGVFYTGSFDPVLRWLPLLLAIFGGRALLAWFNTWLAQRAAAEVKSQLRRDIMAARLAQPVNPRASASTLVTLITQGLDNLDGYFSKYLPQLLLAATVPLIVGVAILTEDLLSAVIIAVTIPLIPIFMALIGWATEKYVQRRWRVQTRLAHHFADLVAGLPTLQVFGRARAQLKGLELTEKKHRRETMGTLRVAFLSAMALELLSTLSVAIVAVTVGLRVVAGDMDLTSSLFILILAPEAYLPVRQVGVHFHDSANGVAAAEEAFAEIEAGDAVTAGDARRTRPAPDLAAATIRFDDVGATWPGSDTPALRGLSFEWSPGDVVAIAGTSGGGKSTALAVLLGFIPPDRGRITITGADAEAVGLDEVDLDSWRRQIAWVGQHPGMLDGTVADTIALGTSTPDRPAVSQQILRTTLDAAGGQDLALDREVGEAGAGLSSGERRRVALARALVRLEHDGGRLLVLDEPTAGMDADTEARVINTLRATGVGAIVVTHRPALLAAADRVIRLSPAAEPAASEAADASGGER